MRFFAWLRSWFKPADMSHQLAEDLSKEPPTAAGPLVPMLLAETASLINPDDDKKIVYPAGKTSEAIGEALRLVISQKQRLDISTTKLDCQKSGEVLLTPGKPSEFSGDADIRIGPVCNFALWPQPIFTANPAMLAAQKKGLYARVWYEHMGTTLPPHKAPSGRSM